MAEELFDVADFWLPSDFVYDDLLLEADRRWKALATGQAPPAAGKSFLVADLVDGYASNSDSPAADQSAESDEEDFLAGLTRRMTRSFLIDGDKDARASVALEAAAKSTLCGWQAAEKACRNSSPISTSPPLSREEQPGRVEPWSLLSEAAGQVMRLKLSDLEHRRDLFERGLLVSQRQPSPAVPVPNMNASSNATLPTIQQVRAAQFYRLKQLQLLQQQQQKEQQLRAKQLHTENSGGGHGESRCVRRLGLSPSAWPPLQKQRQPSMTGSGDGLRAVFLNSAKKQCAGTGVFIPRSAGGKANEPPRKKTVSSTVLVPTRVVQALNLNLEEFCAQPQFSSTFSIDNGKPSGGFIGWNNAPTLQKRNPPPAHLPTVLTTRDLRLPQEWSY